MILLLDVKHIKLVHFDMTELIIGDYIPNFLRLTNSLQMIMNSSFSFNNFRYHQDVLIIGRSTSIYAQCYAESSQNLGKGI
ncbi:hypothetical protein DERP_003491 [Dermatophagoides pteronyssinus]|uniref:Uncharacterized protein n=1 Tax=Dermatophagoides pteronyssinus TaxID=6956 RepID=A0ABQ8JKS8_DERPT|nr:hypothetical protein DERP_003491 [Dermatophagoides pteronyssinus]